MNHVYKLSGLKLILVLASVLVMTPFAQVTAQTGSITLNFPSGGSTNGWSPMVKYFSDPVPSGAVITAVDITYSAKDQGWGGSNGVSTMTINGTTVGTGTIHRYPTVNNFTINYSGCLPDYVYGGQNQLRMYFVGYGGWRADWLGGTVTLHYSPRESVPPVIAGCLSDFTIMAGAGQTSEQAFWVAPTATDNSSVCSFTSNYNPGDDFPLGTTQVIYTAVDPSGNTTQCQFNVTIIESVTPTAVSDHFAICLNGAVTFSDADLLGNDSDPQNDPLKVEEISAPVNGSLVYNGNGTYTYTPNPGFSGTEVLEYVIKKDDGYTAFPENNHFYEFVPANAITWTAARAAASNRYYQGMRGYLVTITTASENVFVSAKLQGQGWLGASDVGAEGVWKWVTGPEAGTHFSNQFKYGWCNAITAPGINGNFAKWGGGEPNDCGSGEDYAHFLNSGSWNDYPNSVGGNIRGYVVEYGGLESTISPLTATGSIIIEVNTPPVIALEPINISCFGSLNGSIDLILTAGTPPFNFNWSNGAATEDISGLAPGEYVVTVTDSKGCSAGASVTLTEPAKLTSSISAPPILCFGDLISQTNHVVSGGTEPYSYLWSNGETTLDLFAIGAGTYGVTVTDAHGCAVYSEITMTQPATPLSVTGTSSDYNGYEISCYDGSDGLIDLTVSGGTPGTGGYVYNWSNGAVTEDMSGLSAGAYSVTVSDQNGCSADLEFVLNDPEPLISAPIEGEMVFLGYQPAESAMLEGNLATGGVEPYDYQWFDSNGNLLDNGQNVIVSPTETAVFSYIITDANGCQLIVDGTVCVVDITCTAGNGKGKGKAAKKVSICHIPEGNPANEHTICVSVNAVPDHLANGDLLGPCGTLQVCDGSFKMGGFDTGSGAFTSNFIFNLYPNPARDYANVVFNVEKDCNLMVTLTDLSGKVLQTVYDQPVEANMEYREQIDTQSLPQGVYFVRMVSDTGLISVLRLSVL